MAAAKNADIVVCSILEVQAGGIQTILTFDFDDGTVFERPEIIQHILRPVLKYGGGLYASMCNKIYKSSLIKYSIKAGSHRNYGEDWFFNQLALGRAKKIAFLKEPLYQYLRINPNSIMLSYRRDLFNLHLDSRVFLKERMMEWGLNSNNNQYNANTRFCKKVFEAIVNEMSTKNPVSITDKFTYINNIVVHHEVQFAARNAEKNFISYCLIKRYSFLLSVYAWYLAVLKPVLHKAKVVVIK